MPYKFINFYYFFLYSNYAPTLYVQKNAEAQNHQQILWLFGEDHRLVEVGTMNIFIYMKTANGGVVNFVVQSSSLL